MDRTFVDFHIFQLSAADFFPNDFVFTVAGEGIDALVFEEGGVDEPFLLLVDLDSGLGQVCDFHAVGENCELTVANQNLLTNDLVVVRSDLFLKISNRAVSVYTLNYILPIGCQNFNDLIVFALRNNSWTLKGIISSGSTQFNFFVSLQ
jgi:hypothetical protein